MLTFYSLITLEEYPDTEAGRADHRADVDAIMQCPDRAELERVDPYGISHDAAGRRRDF